MIELKEPVWFSELNVTLGANRAARGGDGGSVI